MAGKDVFRKVLLLAVERARPIAVALIVAGYVGGLLLPLLAKAKFTVRLHAPILEQIHPKCRTAGSSTSVKSVFGTLKSIAKEITEHDVATVLRRQGMQVHTQSFPSEDGSRNCSNRYVIVPSARGDGSEGLSLVTPVSMNCPPGGPRPWYSQAEPCWNQTTGAAASVLTLGTALTLHLQGVPWLARDFVWLIPDASCGLLHSTQAWADLAMGRDALAAAARGASVKAGRLQQAVIVEAQGGLWQAAEVSVVGRQGLLPKLDVMLLINHFLRTQLRFQTYLPQRRPAVLERLKASLPPPTTKEQQQYAGLLQGTLSFVAMQVGGMPDGAHAAFKEYAVDAVTARMVSVTGSPTETDSPSARQVLQLAAALEGTLRSLNNLLERLHHSYFMYLLPATHKFVPIEAYTLPPALLLLALFLLAANSCLCLPAKRPPRPPSGPDAGHSSEHGDSRGVAAKAEVEPETYPRQMMQQITIRGGWAAVTQSCSKVAVVHAAAAAVGLGVHFAAAHAAGGSAWAGEGLIWPPLLVGAVSSACIVSVLVEEGFRTPWSEDAARMHHAASLLSTIVLMGAWMFVNWADVYVALLCCTPVIAWRKTYRARWTLLMVVGCSAWVAINPWALMVEEADPSRTLSIVDVVAWLFRLSPTSQAFVWLVYVPTWVKPWL